MEQGLYRPSRSYGSIEEKSQADQSKKLGTLNGVFLPTALNVLSILLFLRFGFVIGQAGVLGTFALLFMSYGINLLTTLSVSAIATNGTVRGGGAYYMISRSLGVEFGGAIGIIFYIGQMLNSALNVVGFVEPLLVNLGRDNGLLFPLLESGYWHQFLYSTILLFCCTAISLVGAGTVSKAANFLFVILLVAIVSIPVSTFFVQPFEVPKLNSFYSGPSWDTLWENMLPNFTEGAAGSESKSREDFRSMFGIFFPAAAGIFAGASMSGDLKKPSKAIPEGTLWGLLLTFSCYGLVILSMGASIPRDLLYKDVQVVQSVNLSQLLILLGEFSTALFSVVVGIVGSAKVLQAIATDAIIPGLGIFAKGFGEADDPVYGILCTWGLTQVVLFANVNQIATLITMAFLMTFIVTNLACFLLKIGSAPNFRPSFRYFNTATAGGGVVACGIAMFIVDGLSACLIVIFLMFLILLIHYISPPKQWGDVSQSLIYHQVRKYLLRLRQDNVKYWRPQILLLVDNPRTGWKLMNFCNNLKKGGLYVLGHVIVSETFQDRYAEFKRQNRAWSKLREITKIKAFTQIGLGPTITWGVRNVFLGSGLGGMKPNICVLGFFNLSDYHTKNSANCVLKSNGINDQRLESTHREYKDQVTVDMESLPTDFCRSEQKISLREWVHIIEDLLILESNVAVAKGFPRLQLPTKQSAKLSYEARHFIDLYPIQMSAQIVDEAGVKSALTTNFDTYTLILQLGAILETVPEWERTHKLRVVVFVEYEDSIEDERSRVNSLLEILRIKAEVLILCLSGGEFPIYDYITKGVDNSQISGKVESVFAQDEWWSSVKESRGGSKRGNASGRRLSVNPQTIQNVGSRPKRRLTLSNIQRMGVSLNMRAGHLPNEDYGNTISDDEFDDSSSDFDTRSMRSESTTKSIKPKMARNPSQRSFSSLKRQPFKLDSGEGSKLSLPGKNTPKRITSKPNFSSLAIPQSHVVEDASGDQPSIMFLPESNRKREKSSLGKEWRDPFKPGAECESIISEAEEPLEFSFDDITAKAQHLILNHLMLRVSSKSAVIFSTLPTPAIGCHKSEKDSLEYVQNLDLWCDGLPPILLINAQTMTVTTAL